MLDLLQSLIANGDATWIFGLALPVTLVSVASIVAETIRKLRLGEQELALKQSMIDRGMSADEIERVVRATRTSKADRKQAGKGVDVKLDADSAKEVRRHQSVGL